MQKALNTKNFQTFTKQVKGARVGEISVKREEGPKGLRLKYSARDPKTRRVFNGDWIVARPATGDAAGEMAAGEKEFLDLAAKEFAVHKQES